MQPNMDGAPKVGRLISGSLASSTLKVERCKAIRYPIYASILRAGFWDSFVFLKLALLSYLSFISATAELRMIKTKKVKMLFK